LFCKDCQKIFCIIALLICSLRVDAQTVQVAEREPERPNVPQAATPTAVPPAVPAATSSTPSSIPLSRLKIGLVLSGGGARGIAHVGVLKWFEEHRIPVDLVAGTSMGGLVGAFHAMGSSSTEMQEILNSIQWDEMLSTGPNFSQLSFRRKEDRRAFQSKIELGLRHGVALPLGLSTDHYIGLLFDRLTLPYAGIGSFDELPTPFRCVATDFLRGESVVLKDGPLASAMRATMSIPGVFRPVERDGRVLVDGGLLNNIPTDVIKELDPDVVIAVDVGTPLGDIDSIASLAGILSQSVSIMLIESDRRNLRLADIIISPELGGHSFLDFSTPDRIIEIGYQAAKRKAAVLERFALGETEWNEYLARRAAKKRTAVPVPDAIVIAGVPAGAQKRLRNRLSDFVGRPLEPQKLETELTRVTGQGRYEGLEYTVLPGSGRSNLNLLQITAKEKYSAPPTLNFGLEIDGSEVDEIDFTIGGRLTVYDIGKYGAEWRSDIKLGFGNLFGTEYFYPLGSSGIFAAPRAAYRRESFNVFEGDANIAQYQMDGYGAGFDLGYVNRLSELRVGYEIGRINAIVRTGDPVALPSADGTLSLARVRWSYDGQDSATIPTRGLRLVAEGRWYFQTPAVPDNFSQAEIRLSAFHPMRERGSFFFAGSGGTSFNQQNVGTQLFTLGGPFRLGAYDRDQFRGNRYLLLSAGYLHRLSQLPSLIGGRVYATGWYDFGGAFGGINSNTLNNRYRNAISVGLVADTILGPLSLIGSFGEGGQGKIYFSVGKFF
jgi:NTE family protein